MNNNVLEIINLLVQKLIREEQASLTEEELIEELVTEGYELQDIDRALELIFTTPDIIDEEIERNFASYNRVFTVVERLYLPVKLQGLIKRLIFLNLLTTEESENFIARMIQNSYNGHTGMCEVWDILEEIIEDEAKLEIILQEIPEFNQYRGPEFKYVN